MLQMSRVVGLVVPWNPPILQSWNKLPGVVSAGLIIDQNRGNPSENTKPLVFLRRVGPLQRLPILLRHRMQNRSRLAVIGIQDGRMYLRVLRVFEHGAVG